MAGQVTAAGVAILHLDDVTGFGVATGSRGNRVQYRLKSAAQAHDLLAVRNNSDAINIARKLGHAKHAGADIDILDAIVSAFEEDSA